MNCLLYKREAAAAAEAPSITLWEGQKIGKARICSKCGQIKKLDPHPLLARERSSPRKEHKSKVPRRPDRPGAQMAQVRRPQDLHAVDVEDALLARHELEVDEVRERPQRVVSREHRQQLGRDGRQDQVRPPFERVHKGEKDAREGRGPEELVEDGLGDDGLGGGGVLREDVVVERRVPEVACLKFFFRGRKRERARAGRRGQDFFSYRERRALGAASVSA